MPERVDQQIVEDLSNPAPVDVYVGADRLWATVEVTDHGDGVPPHAIDPLFEPFGLVGLSRHVDSTGLGLSSS